MAQVLTYEMYEKAVKDSAESVRTTAKDAAKALYELQQAEAQKQRGAAVTQADSAFDRSQATYGLNAEYLAQAGLNNSGYSDNLARDAYVARQQGYDTANVRYADLMDSAKRTQAEAHLNADIAYNQAVGEGNEKLMEYKQMIRDNFETIKPMIDETATSQEINDLIRSYGFDINQSNQLYAIAGFKPMTEVQYNKIIGNIPEESKKKLDDIKAEFEKVGTEGGKTKDDFKTMLEAAAQDAYIGEDLAEWINSNKDGLEALYPKQEGGQAPEGGQTSGSVIDGILSTIQPGSRPEAIDTAFDAVKKIIENASGSEAEMAASISTALNDLGSKYPNLTAEEKKAILDYLEAESAKIGVNGQIYSNGSVESFLALNGGYDLPSWLSSTEQGGGTGGANIIEGMTARKSDFSASAGENFNIKYNNNTYKAQLGTKVTDPNVVTAAKGVKPGQIFTYGNSIYVRIGDDENSDVWSVEARDMLWLGQGESYNKLIDAVLNSESKENIGKITYRLLDSSGSIAKDNNLRIADSMNRWYKIEVDEDVSGDTVVKNAAKDLSDETVFRVKDDLYIRDGEGDDYKVWRLKKEAGNNGSYKRLLEDAETITAEKLNIEDLNQQVGTNIKTEPDADVDMNWYGSGDAIDFTVTIGNKTYKVQGGGEAPADVKNAAKNNNIANETLFWYTDSKGETKLYVTNQNGNVLSVAPRDIAGRKWQYTELMNALGSYNNVDFEVTAKPDNMKKGDDLTYKVGEDSYKVESKGPYTLPEGGSVTKSGDEYSVKLGGETKTVKELEPFYYKDENDEGHVLVVFKDDVYEIRERNVLRTGAYKNLLADVKSDYLHERSKSGN